MIKHMLMTKSVVLTAAACVLVALAGCEAAPSPAKLVIVEAVYGNLPDGLSTDVTAQVAAMVKDNTLRVEASNDLFGDPEEGIIKKLRVNYTLDGAPASRTVGENEILILPADEKPLVGKLVIVKAVYGDLAGHDVFDATAEVAAMVKDNALTVVASNDNFGDPAEGVFKRLRVDYTIRGVARRKTVGENQTLTISGNPRSRP